MVQLDIRKRNNFGAHTRVRLDMSLYAKRCSSSRRCFNNVLHAVLTEELRRCQCPANLLKVVTSFLNSCTLYTTAGRMESDEVFIQNGVTQGFSISTALFALFMASQQH